MVSMIYVVEYVELLNKSGAMDVIVCRNITLHEPRKKISYMFVMLEQTNGLHADPVG